MTSIGIIGAGVWGTALGQILAENDRRVTIWARREDQATQMNAEHSHDGLPGVTLSRNLHATTDYAALDTANILIYALPAQVLRAHLSEHPLKPHQTLVIAAKGIELGSGKLLPDVVHDLSPAAMVAVLSGPNIALEVARGLPAASTLACADDTHLKSLQSLLSTRTFRLYPTTDIIGTSVGGAVKNVIIMASGIVDGMQLGDNARAAVLTRGLAEMVRLATAMGGQRETLMGLSGMGDLNLKTRNYRFGLSLADGNLHDINSHSTIEGVSTAQAVVTLAGRLGVEMPICVAVAACLSGQLDVRAAVDRLLQRPARNSEQE